MRSVYAKIALWCFCTLLVSLGAFFQISRVIGHVLVGRNVEHNSPMERMSVLQLYQAQRAYEKGGPAALAEDLAEMSRFMGAEHHVTDARGRDLITGEDRSAMLAEARRPQGPPGMTRGKVILAATSADGRYRLLVVAPPPPSLTPGMLAPFYLLVIAVVGLMSWPLAVYIAKPLRKLAVVVERFGRGDLAARANSRRKDELGELACAFDNMADRIQTLLNAERRLLQDISHELRSPLARLSFAAELTRTATDRDAAVARLKKEIDRLTALVGALLQVTRAEGDPSRRRHEEIDLEKLLGEVAADCQIEADERRCRVVLEAPAKVVVQGDPELLRRAIENIVRNAVRYAPEQSRVELRLNQSAQSAEVTVRDYGPGVPEDDLPKIFSPFFRVDSSRDSATGGLGLGLAIAHRAVLLHHGRLAASNANPGLLVSLSVPAASGA